VRLTERFILFAHPVDIALRVLLSTGTGSNGVYDVLPARHGLGIPQALVDVGTFVAVKADLSSTDLFYFAIDQAESDAKAWLEAQIFKPCNAYQVTRADGRLSMKLFEPPEPDAALFVFDDNNTLPLPNPNGNFTRQFNQAVWRYDWDEVLQKYLANDTYDDATSQAKYGQAYAMVIESKGIRTTLSGHALSLARSQRFFSRYAEPPIEFELAAFFSAFPVEPGDLVTFKNSFVIDPRSGNRGITSALTLEVISKSMNFQAGTISFRLLYTPFASFRYAKWGAVGMADYASATIADRARFAFIGTDTDANGVADLPDTPDGPGTPLDEPYRYQ
jgi:hypothetical protein